MGEFSNAMGDLARATLRVLESAFQTVTTEGPRLLSKIPGLVGDAKDFIVGLFSGERPPRAGVAAPRRSAGPPEGRYGARPVTEGRLDPSQDHEPGHGLPLHPRTRGPGRDDRLSP